MATVDRTKGEKSRNKEWGTKKKKKKRKRAERRPAFVSRNRNFPSPGFNLFSLRENFSSPALPLINPPTRHHRARIR